MLSLQPQPQRLRRRAVVASAAPQRTPEEERAYVSRLLVPEADPVAGRDNLSSNLKLAAGVALFLAALVGAFLRSNGLL